MSATEQQQQSQKRARPAEENGDESAVLTKTQKVDNGDVPTVTANNEANANSNKLKAKLTNNEKAKADEETEEQAHEEEDDSEGESGAGGDEDEQDDDEEDDEEGVEGDDDDEEGTTTTRMPKPMRAMRRNKLSVQSSKLVLATEQQHLFVFCFDLLGHVPSRTWVRRRERDVSALLFGTALSALPFRP
uniref:Prothymosin alpha n=1 Tax=Globodera pallida TaxID=36090 RepID=A0A183BK02_GLOPA